jgi:hypothetical protein
MSKRLSRRKFLTILVAITSSTIIGGLIVYRWKAWFLAPFRDLYQQLVQLVQPGLKDSLTGPLNAGVLQVLLVIPETLVDTAVETSHYESFFRWRSENLRGYKGLYEQFTLTLNHVARQAEGCDFVDCDMATRRKILKKTRLWRKDKMNKLKRVVFERDWFRFEQYIINQILTLFNNTDAWILLGYESWPGTPRGLDGYMRAPRKAE